MSEQPKKATDLILEMSAKLDSVLALVRNIELSNKLINNKLNQVMLKPVTQISVEAEKTVEMPVIEVESNPQGIRRTSRDVEPIAYKKPAPKHVPVSSAGEVNTDIIVPSAPVSVPVEVQSKPAALEKQHNFEISNVPVSQRVVDKNGKSVFMAVVSIYDSSTGKLIKDIKTSSVGKWMISLPPGDYKAYIVKKDPVKDAKPSEGTQNFTIDGKTPTLELPNVTITKNV